MGNEETNSKKTSDGVELDGEQLDAVSGGGYLNVNVPLATTEGKGLNPPVLEKPLKRFGPLNENS